VFSAILVNKDDHNNSDNNNNNYYYNDTYIAQIRKVQQMR